MTWLGREPSPGQGNDQGWTLWRWDSWQHQVRQAQLAGSLGDGNSAAQGTLRLGHVARVALSSLVSSMQNGKSPVEGLRKVASVASPARRQFHSRLWDPDHSKSCSWLR